MLKKGLVAAAIAASITMMNPVMACSNVFIVGQGVSAVARTMDLELNTGNTFAYGATGVSNISNINLPQAAPIKAMRWVNKYAFLGQSGFHSYVVVDGLNSQGLYAGYLDLPDLSAYPVYNPKDPRPELGVTDVINYLLGTAASVPEAIMQIMKVQAVRNSFELTLILKNKNITLFGGNAIHLALRDKFGNAAVLEWTSIHGKPVLDIYMHKAGTKTVVKTVPGYPVLTTVFHNTLGGVLTNAPSYDWQLQNASHYNYVFTGNTDRQWNGTYQNGSGMAGIPGEWTPVARFARATQMLRLFPMAHTEQEALTLAYTALQSVQVPLGTNPATTEWITLSDLENSVYYFKPVLYVEPNFKLNLIKAALPPFDEPWQSYNVKQLAIKNEVPAGWVSAQVVPQQMGTAEDAVTVEKMALKPTPGNVKTTVELDAAISHAGL